ncbi:MAG: hypothetical protein ACM3VS_08875 [Candidatus Dadabacteria bacterium]
MADNNRNLGSQQSNRDQKKMNQQERNQDSQLGSRQSIGSQRQQGGRISGGNPGAKERSTDDLSKGSNRRDKI